MAQVSSHQLPMPLPSFSRRKVVCRRLLSAVIGSSMCCEWTTAAHPICSPQIRARSWSCTRQQVYCSAAWSCKECRPPVEPYVLFLFPLWCLLLVFFAGQTVLDELFLMYHGHWRSRIQGADPSTLIFILCVSCSDFARGKVRMLDSASIWILGFRP